MWSWGTRIAPWANLESAAHAKPEMADFYSLFSDKTTQPERVIMHICTLSFLNAIFFGPEYKMAFFPMVLTQVNYFSSKLFSKFTCQASLYLCMPSQY